MLFHLLGNGIAADGGAEVVALEVVIRGVVVLVADGGDELFDADMDVARDNLAEQAW